MGQPGRASKYRGPGKEDGAIPVGFLKGGGPESEAQECLRPRSGRSAREGGRGSGPSGRSTETVAGHEERTGGECAGRGPAARGDPRHAAADAEADEPRVVVQLIAKRVRRVKGGSHFGRLARYVVDALGGADPASWQRTADYILDTAEGGAKVGGVRISNCISEDPAAAPRGAPQGGGGGGGGGGGFLSGRGGRGARGGGRGRRGGPPAPPPGRP